MFKWTCMFKSCVFEGSTVLLARSLLALNFCNEVEVRVRHTPRVSRSRSSGLGFLSMPGAQMHYANKTKESESQRPPTPD